MTGPATIAPPTPPSLVRLAAPAVAGTSVAQKGRIPLPTELIICPWGRSKDLQGNDVIVNETTLRELAANQARYGFDEVALDFAHNTTPKTDAEGNPLPTPEPQLIAAFGPLSVIAGKGIVHTPRYWTPEGESSYTGRHYPDLSPTVGKNEKGEVTFVHSAALTRAGQISGLHAFSAPGLPALTHLQTTPPMDTPTTDYKALLLQKLGIDAAATDEQIIAACSTPAATSPPAAPLAAPNIIPLDATVVTKLDALQADFDAMKKDNLIAEAARAGKVIPLSAESVKLTPLSVIEEMVKSTLVTVPLSATNTNSPLPALKALSAEEKAVCERFGYTEEQYRKANS